MQPDEKSPARVRVTTALVLFAMFLAGLATGAALCRLGMPRPPHPPGLPLPHELGLSREQEEKAAAIRERYRPDLDAVLKDAMPRVRAIEDRMGSDLRGILTPEQARRLVEFEAKHPPPGPPGLPPGPPPPPPPGMLDACRGGVVGAPCRIGGLEGICRPPPGGPGPLACVPGSGPDAGR